MERWTGTVDGTRLNRSKATVGSLGSDRRAIPLQLEATFTIKVSLVGMGIIDGQCWKSAGGSTLRSEVLVHRSHDMFVLNRME